MFLGDLKELIFFDLLDSCSKNHLYYIKNSFYCDFLLFLRFFDNGFTLELNFLTDVLLFLKSFFFKFLSLFLGNLVFYFLLFFVIYLLKIFLNKVFRLKFPKFLTNFFENNLIIFGIFLNMIPKIGFLSIFFIIFSKINFKKKVLFLTFSVILNFFVSFLFYSKFFFYEGKKFFFIEKLNFYDHFSHFSFGLLLFVIFSLIYNIFNKIRRF